MKEFPMIRSAQAAGIGTLLIAGPLLLLSLSPLLGMYAAMLVIFLLPTALCTAGLVCGFLPMMAGAAAGLFSMYQLAHFPGLQLTAVYILPILAAFIFIMIRQIPFRKACPIMIGVHVASLAAAYLLLQQMAGGQLYTLAGDAVASALENWEMGDSMLYQFYMMGLINLPEELAEGMLMQVGEAAYTLSAQARADLLLSVRTMVNTMLLSLLPSLIVQQSLLGGVGCLLLPLRFGFIAAERRAFRGNGENGYIQGEDGKKTVDFPDLGMEPLSMWHLPRGIGWQVGAALAAGYLMQQSAVPALALGGILLYSAASTVFVIQGFALINFLQKAKGSKRPMRIIVPILLFFLSVLMYVGIFDQITNIRVLRKHREPEEE